MPQSNYVLGCTVPAATVINRASDFGQVLNRAGNITEFGPNINRAKVLGSGLQE